MAIYQVEMARVGRSVRDGHGVPVPVWFQIDAKTDHEIMDRLDKAFGPRLASSGWTLRLEWDGPLRDAGKVDIDGGRYGSGTIRDITAATQEREMAEAGTIVDEYAVREAEEVAEAAASILPATFGHPYWNELREGRWTNGEPDAGDAIEILWFGLEFAIHELELREGTAGAIERLRLAMSVAEKGRRA